MAIEHVRALNVGPWRTPGGIALLRVSEFAPRACAHLGRQDGTHSVMFDGDFGSSTIVYHIRAVRPGNPDDQIYPELYINRADDEIIFADPAAKTITRWLGDRGNEYIFSKGRLERV